MIAGREARVPIETDTETAEKGLVEKRPDSPRAVRSSVAVRAGAMGAAAWGALALGAVAIGAVVIGRLSLGALRLRKGTIGHLRVDRLEIGEIVNRSDDMRA